MTVFYFINFNDKLFVQVVNFPFKEQAIPTSYSGLLFRLRIKVPSCRRFRYFSYIFTKSPDFRRKDALTQPPFSMYNI